LKLQWTKKGLGDLARLNEFLAAVDAKAAAHTIKVLATAAGHLPLHPRIGEKLEQYEPREIRRLIVGTYEMRYEISATAITILRLWHAREER
jgi:plasmid stabilization system protein ParE